MLTVLPWSKPQFLICQPRDRHQEVGTTSPLHPIPGQQEPRATVMHHLVHSKAWRHLCARELLITAWITARIAAWYAAWNTTRSPPGSPPSAI